MKKNFIYVLIIFLVLLIAYKAILLTKYRASKVDIDTKVIFNETLTISNEKYDGDYISIDNIEIANLFEGYVDVDDNFKAKYDGDTVVAFYSVGSLDQYINILDTKNFEIMTDKFTGYVPTHKIVKEYLNDHGVKNDIDLFKYIKDNYYFKNTVFMSANRIKINYLLNTFVGVSLPSFSSITLIDGNINGYIFNIKNDSDKSIKEIHLLNDDKQYIIVLGGNEITNNDFITKLLSTIVYK